MAKYNVCGFEIDSEEIIQGAAIGAGIAFVIVGIKKFFDARSLRFEQDELDYEEDEIMDEILLEEYKEERREELIRAEKGSVLCGTLSVVFGSLLAAAGIIGFTPLKKTIVSGLPEIDIKDKVADLGIRDRIADIGIREKVTDLGLKDKIADLDIKDRISGLDIKDRIAGLDLKDKISGLDIVEKIPVFVIKKKLSDADFMKLIAKYDVDDLKDKLSRVIGK